MSTDSFQTIVVVLLTIIAGRPILQDIDANRRARIKQQLDDAKADREFERGLLRDRLVQEKLNREG